MPYKQAEHEIQSKIIDWLRKNKIICWRQNSGGVRANYRGKERFVKFAYFIFPNSINEEIQLPDILGFHKGMMFGIEVKKPGENAEPGQKRFLDLLIKNCHLGIETDNLEKVIKEFARHGIV